MFISQDVYSFLRHGVVTFPFVAAGIVAQKDQQVLENLQEAGRLIGLAFQVRDDILDVTADFEELGKTPGKDVVAGKSTYPALLGLEKSHAILEESLDKAEAIFRNLSETQGFKKALFISQDVYSFLRHGVVTFL